MFGSYWSRRWVWICLLCTRCFCQNYPPWPYGTPYPLSRHSVQHCFSSRNSLHSKRSGAIGPCSRNSWNSYHVSHHPKVAGLVEKWDGLLKTHSQCQLAGNIFLGWGEVPRKAVCSLTQRSLYSAVSPTAGIHGSRNEGGEMGVAPLTFIPSDQLARLLLPVPMTLCFAGLEV